MRRKPGSVPGFPAFGRSCEREARRGGMCAGGGRGLLL